MNGVQNNMFDRIKHNVHHLYLCSRVITCIKKNIQFIIRKYIDLRFSKNGKTVIYIYCPLIST